MGRIAYDTSVTTLEKIKHIRRNNIKSDAIKVGYAGCCECVWARIGFCRIEFKYRLLRAR
jgi:hypothetical protein